jgi:ethanolamine utilization protein EutQ
MKRVISDEMVEREHKAGRRRIAAPPSETVITPAAWSKARELGVDLVRDEPKPSSSSSSGSRSTLKVRPVAPAKRSKHPAKGSAKREADASGVVVVRGGSVVLGAFPDAGKGKDVGLFDVVGAADRSPMAAGFMSWGREDSFAWSLDYDEVDYVVDGVLRVEIDGRAVEARAGDVVFIPKGSKIVFATPSRVKVFYVTHPVSWAGAGPARPQT